MRKKRILILASVSLAVAAVYYIIYTREEPLLRIINGLGLVGVFNICAALWCHVRNSGQFKILGYAGYSRYKSNLKRDIKDGVLPENMKVLEFRDYMNDKYRKKWDPLPFYVCGGPLVLVSLVLIPIWNNFN